MYCHRLHARWSTQSRLATLLSSWIARWWFGLSPPVKYFTDRSKAVLLLWIFYVIVLPCVCYVFVCVCLYVLCGHLLGKGWPLGSRLWCLAVSLSPSNWCPGSGVVLDCIQFLIFTPLLTLSITKGIVPSEIYDKRDNLNFEVINFPYLDGNVPHSPSYGIYISRSIRFARVCLMLMTSTKQTLFWLLSY